MKYLPKSYCFLLFLVGSTSFADCDLKVATSAGQYLEALEKAELRKYQNSSVCEVLSYEFNNCSKKQKKVLASHFNLKEVLGNYCQPLLPPPRNHSYKDIPMKGIELFSWQEPYGYIWYTLLPGTNRLKRVEELTGSKMNLGQLIEEIAFLPPKTEITWNNLVVVEDEGKSKVTFLLPDEKVKKTILKKAAASKLKIAIVR